MRNVRVWAADSSPGTLVFIEILQFAHVPGISPWPVEVVWIELH